MNRSSALKFELFSLRRGSEEIVSTCQILSCNLSADEVGAQVERQSIAILASSLKKRRRAPLSISIAIGPKNRTKIRAIWKNCGKYFRGRHLVVEAWCEIQRGGSLGLVRSQGGPWERVLTRAEAPWWPGAAAPLVPPYKRLVVPGEF